MGKRGPESYMKRQKELKRKQKAMEKMARRQGKRLQRAADAALPAGEGAPPTEDLWGQEPQGGEPTPAP